MDELMKLTLDHRVLIGLIKGGVKARYRKTVEFRI